MSEGNGDRSLKWYFSREPVILIVLSTLAVLSFLGVSALSRVYHAQQASLAEKWFLQATQDEEEGRLERAVREFQTAELYSRGNLHYQLSLAKTLAGLNRTDEAISYLLNFREQGPDNPEVNLELARIFARKGDTSQAIRYYHDTIYAVWPADPDVHRRAARFELVELLLRENAATQAQSELIAMAASLPPDAPLLTHVGDLFFRAQDYPHALVEYAAASNLDPENAAALAGAGRAAFELRNYASAQRFLEAAVAANPGDSTSAELLKTSELVLAMDPFRHQIPASQRSQLMIDAFEVAGQRLKDCPLRDKIDAQNAETSQSSLETRWKELEPQVNQRALQKNSDLVDRAMELVFAIEQQAAAECGTPKGKDLALLLLSKLHEGSER